MKNILLVPVDPKHHQFFGVEIYRTVIIYYFDDSPSLIAISFVPNLEMVS